jgi:hypothetical protein
LRILIGNHIDPAIRDRGDLRAWTQRVLWFAHDGDMVVLCDEPDQQFLAHVTSYTGVDPATLRVLVPAAVRHGGRLLDPESLTSDLFVRTARDALGVGGLADVEEVFALWPSAHVSRFAAALDLEGSFPGAAFFAQGGGELSNNKATFRALAAGAGVPIPAGTVARSEREAIDATAALLAQAGAVIVKQAHNGAGVGNQLLLRDASLAVDHVGARHLHHIDSGRGEPLAAYWKEHWDWASAYGRFPVVIEEFQPHASSVYSEHYADDDGTHPMEMGRLLYVGRRLSHQIVPLREVEETIRTQLLRGGERLAETYWALGYRGHMSADAIITPDGRVLFTEVNAQVSGSLHIYKVIAHRIVDTTASPERSVVEYHVPPTWAVPDLGTFLAVARELGCGYDPATRTGVIVSMPVIPLEPRRAQFVFCIAYAADADRQKVLETLDKQFATVPADSYTASDHIGVPGPVHRLTPAPGGGIMMTTPDHARRASLVEAVQLAPTFDDNRLAGELAAVTGHHWQPQRIHAPGGGIGADAAIDWRVLPLRSPGGDADRTDPGGPGPADFAPTIWLNRLPYLREILDGIPAPLNAVRLMSLGPGAASRPHCDPKYRLDRGFVRLHIPLVTHPDAVLVLDGVEHCWQPGTFWYGDFSREHMVRNVGPVRRVHAVVDALLTRELAGWFPPEWQMSLTLNSDVLFNRFPAPSGACLVAVPYAVSLPRGFTDFDHDQPLEGRIQPVKITENGGVLTLATADRVFALASVGDGEYRFAGWSEQRTIQFTSDGVLLRTRRGHAVCEHHLPTAVVGPLIPLSSAPSAPNTGSEDFSYAVE